MRIAFLLVCLFLMTASGQAAEVLRIFDAHIHYSHDAWDKVPPAQAIKTLRDAGIDKAFVSSSSDDGTQMLYAEAPGMVIPVLRPYRRRGELGTWFRDPTVVDMIIERLAKNTYAGIGEFHVSGDNANLPVVKSIVQLAKKHGIFLHAHSDIAAVSHIFAQDPGARVLWAHAGFASTEDIAAMMDRYPNLQADLSFRFELARGGKVDADWRELLLAWPDRFMLGTDTYTPERWSDVLDHNNWTRTWLVDLPLKVAEKIAWKNAQKLADWALKE